MRRRIPTRTVLISLTALAAALTSACGRLAFGIANLPTEFGPVERHDDVAYGTGPQQRLDVYALPRDIADPVLPGRPVVVFWFGGGFTHGRKEDYRFVGDALATQGFVALLPDYRMHPQVRYPELLEDPVRAVAWAQQHAGEFGGDPQRIVLMGHSAGAYLAAYLALEREALIAGGADADAIRGFVGLSGPYALDPNSAALRTIFGAPYAHTDWQPIQYASAGDPLALLLHGLEDDVVSPAQTRALRQALERAGVPVEAELYDGRGHADIVAAFSWAARGRVPAIERTSAFIQSVTVAAPAVTGSAPP